MRMVSKRQLKELGGLLYGVWRRSHLGTCRETGRPPHQVSLAEFQLSAVTGGRKEFGREQPNYINAHRQRPKSRLPVSRPLSR
jgi:hypothetical protein